MKFCSSLRTHHYLKVCIEFAEDGQDSTINAGLPGDIERLFCTESWSITPPIVAQKYLIYKSSNLFPWTVSFADALALSFASLPLLTRLSRFSLALSD